MEEVRAAPDEEDKRRRKIFYSINDNVDLLEEILGRLDGRSVGVAACVCRLWRSVCGGDELWERLCNHHVAVGAEARSVVLALGGYQRMYQVCVGPVLGRLVAGRSGRRTGLVWSRSEAQLSLSLFSIDCYERLGGKRSSLMFLCNNPVNVSS